MTDFFDRGDYENEIYNVAAGELGMKKRFCRKCGTKLLEKFDVDGYNEYTGEPNKTNVQKICPTLWCTLSPFNEAWAAGSVDDDPIDVPKYIEYRGYSRGK